MTQKKKNKIIEICIYSLFGALAVWGLVYIILGLLASNLPIPDSQNALRSGDNVIRSHFGLGFFGWGLILFGVFGSLTAFSLIYFAKDVDKDYEKSQRRAARLKRNTPTENKVEEIVDVKDE